MIVHDSRKSTSCCGPSDAKTSASSPCCGCRGRRACSRSTIGQRRNGDGTCAPKGRVNKDAVSAFMDGHFDVERTEREQMPKHPGYEPMSSSRGGSTLLSLRSSDSERQVHISVSTQGHLQGRAGAAQRVGREGRRFWYKERSAIELRDLLAKWRE